MYNEMFHKPSERSSLKYFQEYPLFKHLGMEYGGLTFSDQEGVKFKMYQIWRHWVLGSKGGSLEIPNTLHKAKVYREEFEELLRDLEILHSRVYGSNV